MTTHNTNNKIHRHDSWSEFMEVVKHGKPNPICSELSSRRDEWAQTKPWSGAHDFNEALRWLEKGWEEGITRLKNFQRGIPPELFDCVMPIKDYKPELRHDVAGGAVDIAAHLTGATPETFVTEKAPIEDGAQITTGRKLQSVYFNISNSCFTDENAFFYRGAYTFAMIEHMENCGYSVELWIINNVSDMYNPGEGLRQRIYVKAKEFGELFDTNKLAIALCSNFMLRRFMFSIQEQGDDEEIKRIQREAYGTPQGEDKVEDVALPEDMDLNPIWIGVVNQSDPATMLEVFRKILDRFVNPDTFAA